MFENNEWKWFEDVFCLFSGFPYTPFAMFCLHPFLRKKRGQGKKPNGSKITGYACTSNTTLLNKILKQILIFSMLKVKMHPNNYIYLEKMNLYRYTLTKKIFMWLLGMTLPICWVWSPPRMQLSPPGLLHVQGFRTKHSFATLILRGCTHNLYGKTLRSVPHNIFLFPPPFFQAVLSMSRMLRITYMLACLCEASLNHSPKFNSELTPEEWWDWKTILSLWVSGYFLGQTPQIINFNRVFRVFHEINQPFWDTTIFGNPS